MTFDPDPDINPRGSRALLIVVCVAAVTVFAVMAMVALT